MHRRAILATLPAVVMLIRAGQGLASTTLETRTIGNVGYVKTTYFAEGQTQKISQLISQLLKSLPVSHGFILDIRGCSGGQLREVVGIASLFLPPGTLLFSMMDSNPKQHFRAGQGDQIGDAPLAVLVDKSTSYGAEAIAAAVQDSKRGLIVGEKTAGLASVTDPRGVIGSLSRPSGAPIAGTGVIPDVAVPTVAASAATDLVLQVALKTLAERI
jgi:carboxyl-terminal processing protease